MSLCFYALLAFTDNVTDERLNNLSSRKEDGNWLTVYRTYDAHRYSPLRQINAETVKALKLAYAVPLGGSGTTGLPSFGACV